MAHRRQEKRTTVPLVARRWALARTTAVALCWLRHGHDATPTARKKHDGAPRGLAVDLSPHDGRCLALAKAWARRPHRRLEKRTTAVGFRAQGHG